MKIAGSFLTKKHRASDVILKYDKTDIDYLHVDVMDGKFTSKKSHTIEDVKKYCSLTTKKLDIHLMVKNPIKYINAFNMLNVEYITFHIEPIINTLELIEYIKKYGIKPGIAISPNTSVSKIVPLLPYINQVLIMGVNPGESGQEFMPSVLYKVEALRKMIDENSYPIIISVDGGVNNKNIDLIKEKGADMVISCSYLLDGDLQRNINSLR